MPSWGAAVVTGPEFQGPGGTFTRFQLGRLQSCFCSPAHTRDLQSRQELGPVEMCSDFPSSVPIPHLSLLPVLPGQAKTSVATVTEQLWAEQRCFRQLLL